MIFKSPYPDIEIPNIPIASFILEQAPKFSRNAGADGRTDGALPHLRAVVKCDRPDGRQSGRAGLSERRGLRNSLSERSRVRRCFSRSSATRRRLDDGFAAL